MAAHHRTTPAVGLDPSYIAIEKRAAHLEHVMFILKASALDMQDATKAGLKMPDDFIILNNNKTAGEKAIHMRGGYLYVEKLVIWRLSLSLPRAGNARVAQATLVGVFPTPEASQLHAWLIEIEHALRDHSLMLPQIPSDKPLVCGYSLPVLGLLLAPVNVAKTFGIALPRQDHYLMVAYAGALVAAAHLDSADAFLIDSYDPLCILLYITASLYAPILVPNSPKRVGKLDSYVMLENTGAGIINTLMASKRSMAMDLSQLMGTIVEYTQAGLADRLLGAYKKIVKHCRLPESAAAHFLIYHLLKFFLYVKITSVGVLKTAQLSMHWAQLLLPRRLEDLVAVIIPDQRELGLFYNIITFPLHSHVMSDYWRATIPEMATSERRLAQLAEEALEEIQKYAHAQGAKH